MLVLDEWLEGLKSGRRISSESEVRELCVYVRELLMREATLRSVGSPVTICGDIHGQYTDMLELFKRAGYPPDTSYIFLGDYVDRGRDSVEVFELLMCLKARYPEHMTLLRGNHESRGITQIYGFYDECMSKYSVSVWEDCCRVFDVLNVAALVDGAVLCVHGGLSPQIKTLDQIHTLYRAREPEGALCDLLWSDPGDVDDWVVSNRGAGFLFGPSSVRAFNHTNGLSLISRAHQLVMDGYKFHFDGQVVTVWSAPNYCGRCGNVAAFMQLDAALNSTFVTFQSAADTNQAPLKRSDAEPDFFV